MQKEITIWIWLVNNKWLFIINAIILLLIAIVCLLPRYQLIKLCFEQANMLDMKAYFARPPFFLFVSKDFPSNESFTFAVKGKPLVISEKDIEKNGIKDVLICIGQNASFSCQYASSPVVKVIGYTIAFKSYAIRDINGDGFPDMRVTWDPVQRSEVWFRGQWVEIQHKENRSKTRKCLLDGNWVFFDTIKGAWLPEVK